MFAKVLKKWIAGTITKNQVELLVKTKYLTREQADAIYNFKESIKFPSEE
jgi:hypothetical protein